nr:MAG TPA: hypothetical protein [Caudoviricetes sp.]
MAQLYVLNTTIIPNNGTFVMEDIGLIAVQQLLNEYAFTSAIGHDSTSAIISELVEIEVPTNRATITLDKGDLAIYFKLDKRPPEGEILSKQQIQELGFSWKLIKRID